MTQSEQSIDEGDENVVASLAHVRVSSAGDLRVTGLSAQQLVTALQASGLCVVIDGQAPPRSQMNRLTDREVEVITLISAGYQNVEVAKAMYLSLNTIKSYVRAAYCKMGVETRTQAVLWAVDHGLVPAHPAAAHPTVDPGSNR